MFKTFLAPVIGNAGLIAAVASGSEGGVAKAVFRVLRKRQARTDCRPGLPVSIFDGLYSCNFQALALADGLGYDGFIVLKKGMAITIKLRQIVGKFSRIIAANATAG